MVRGLSVKIVSVCDDAMEIIVIRFQLRAYIITNVLLQCTNPVSRLINSAIVEFGLSIKFVSICDDATEIIVIHFQLPVEITKGFTV